MFSGRKSDFLRSIGEAFRFRKGDSEKVNQESQVALEIEKMVNAYQGGSLDDAKSVVREIFEYLKSRSQGTFSEGDGIQESEVIKIFTLDVPNEGRFEFRVYVALSGINKFYYIWGDTKQTRDAFAEFIK